MLPLSVECPASPPPRSASLYYLICLICPLCGLARLSLLSSTNYLHCNLLCRNSICLTFHWQQLLAVQPRAVALALALAFRFVVLQIPTPAHSGPEIPVSSSPFSSRSSENGLQLARCRSTRRNKT